MVIAKVTDFLHLCVNFAESCRLSLKLLIFFILCVNFAARSLNLGQFTMDVDTKLFDGALPIVATLVLAMLIAVIIIRRRSGHRLPPTVKALPLIGGLLRFLNGPIVMIREEYPKLGSVFTLNLFHKKITFLIGPEVSAHFFKAPESDLSQQEVYQFNVPTFGPGVVFDVDYTVRQEQFRFFTEALRVNKLKGYVDQMVTEAEVLLLDR